MALAMTPLRVIWLMDDTHPREEWVQRIHQLTDGGVDAGAPLHLLDVGGATAPDTRAVMEIVDRVLAGSLDAQHMDEWRQALEQAHTLARSHVPNRDWRTWWFETMPGVFWIAVLVLGGASRVARSDGAQGSGAHPAGDPRPGHHRPHADQRSTGDRSPAKTGRPRQSARAGAGLVSDCRKLMVEVDSHVRQAMPYRRRSRNVAGFPSAAFPQT